MKLRKTICLFMTCMMVISLTACGGSKKANSGPSNNLVADTAWTATGDGSYMTFTGDNDFNWYMEKDVTDDNYFRGTYNFYMGEAALKYLTEDLKDFGYTKDSMKTVYTYNEQYSLDNLVLLTVNNTSFMLDGEEQLSEPKDTYYFGFLLKDGTYLDIANMTTESYYAFIKE